MEDKKVLKENISKNSRELMEKPKVIKGNNSGGDKKGEVNQCREIIGFHKRPLKFQIIFSKIMPTRREVDNPHSCSFQRRIEE